MNNALYTSAKAAEKALQRTTTHTPHNLRLIPALLIIAVTLLSGGCVTATVQEVREAATGMGTGDSVVVLGRAGTVRGAETEEDFVTCIGRNMSGGGDAVEVINQQDFQDAMFPWFEPRIAPIATTDLPELLSQPKMAKRLEEIGLRYLIWVDGSTQRTEESGSMSCTVTPGGAGCFGFLTWEHDSAYEASVWDVRNGTPVGKISSDANGTSFMPAVVVPVPFIARVRSQACNSMADQLKSFVVDDEAS